MILVGDWAPKYFKTDINNNYQDKLVISNLEGPILYKNHTISPISKTGPSLYNIYYPDSKIKYIFTLANNHIMDYGVAGLEITLRKLDELNIKYCGAGGNLSTAREYLTFFEGDRKIGLLSICESQFGVASDISPGVSAFGPWVYKTICEMKKCVDKVIISIHAAMEMSAWPSPMMQDLYRSYIDAGADIIHGHHSHIPQGYELYKNGLIIYGLGNFVVDPDSWKNKENSLWSLAFDVNFDKPAKEWGHFTFSIDNKKRNKKIVVSESSENQLKKHKKYLDLCNYPLNDRELLIGLWQEVSVRSYFMYGESYMQFVTENIKSCSTFNLLKLLQRTYSKPSKYKEENKRDLLRYNMLVCESHHQMLVTALGIFSGAIRDIRNKETKKIVDEMLPWYRGY